MFCQLSDGTFDVEEIKKSRVYTLGKYNEELQDLLLNKFNQFIKENKILKMSFDKKLSLKLLALILYLNESIIRIIDNFDFVFSIPKIVIYLNGEDTINEWMVILLCYLHNIGIDIVIFNPSGSFNINKYIKENKIVINRYEGKARKQSFSKVKNAYVRLLNEDKSYEEICRYNLTEDAGNNTCVKFAELRKENGEWQFKVVSEALEASIQELYNSYR